MSIPAKARIARRRRLQQRQTVIFGTLIAIMLVLGLAAGAMWAGIVPALVNVEINRPSATPTGSVGICPPADITYIPLNKISANVLNGTRRAGLAGTTAGQLKERGIAVGRQDNAKSPFAGTAHITAGANGLQAAFTAGLLFTDPLIDVDSRTDKTIDIVLGASYKSLVATESVSIEPGAAIPSPEGCEPLPSTEPAGESEQG